MRICTRTVHRARKLDDNHLTRLTLRPKAAVMELDTHAATRRASQTSSACQRVFLTAELATLIFLHLDEPAAFNATCRLFHGVASSKYAVYSWLNKRYWKCEQLYELLARPGLRKAEYVDVGRDLLLAEAKLTIGHVTLILQFLLDEKAVPCSRQLICHLVAHSNCCFLYYVS